MDIEKVMDYAKALGLGEKTGIELAESAVGVPSEEAKLAATKWSLKNMLLSSAAKYFTSDLTDDSTKLEETVDEIGQLGGGRPQPRRSVQASERDAGAGGSAERAYR